MTPSELRTYVVSRFVAPTQLLPLVSRVKWRMYPALVRHAPSLAIAIHEPESTRRFWDRLGPGMIVVDGGANMGGYSLLASARVGESGRVFSFEPAPENAARLRGFVAKCGNVEVVERAIGGSVGVAQLHLDTFHAGHSLTIVRGDAGTIEVPVTTMDAFVAEKRLPGIDVLKLDVEGAELDALRGATALLSGARRPTILCEVHAPILPEELRDYLTPFGYVTELLDARFTGLPHEVPVHVLSRPR